MTLVGLAGDILAISSWLLVINKSQGAKSEEQVGHSKSPLIDMKRYEKCSLKTAI